MNKNSQVNNEFIEKMITSLQQIPLTGNRKNMRLLSVLYQDFVLEHTANYEYISTGIALFSTLLLNKEIHIIKGVGNLLNTIFMNLFFSFEHLSTYQKEELLNVASNYYKSNDLNGIELLLFEVIAREYSYDEVLQLFEVIASNPHKDRYIPYISLGLDILYKRAQGNDETIAMIDKFTNLVYVDLRS